jgi:hypothetical protein
MSRNNDWKAGDRVQTYDKNGDIKAGAVDSVTTETRERQEYGGWSRVPKTVTETFVSQVNVKWDNGEEESLKPYQLRAEDNELERQFRLAVPDAHKRIQEKLALAERYLAEAVEISEETGVAFSADISFLSQSYKPSSFGDKFPDVSEELMQEVTSSYNEYEGWQHSAVCY